MTTRRSLANLLTGGARERQARGELVSGRRSAGAESTNIILTKTNAFIFNSTIGSALIPVGDVILEARNTSSIDARVVGVSAAIAGAGGTAISGSIGVSIARNLIGWDVGANNGVVDATSEIQAYVLDSSTL